MYQDEEHTIYVGEATLNVNCANGMRDCYASTNPSNVYPAYLKVVTTYDDGTEYVYETDIIYKPHKYTHDFEWSLDYLSTHRIWTKMETPFAQVKISGN